MTTTWNEVKHSSCQIINVTRNPRCKPLFYPCRDASRLWNSQAKILYFSEVSTRWHKGETKKSVLLSSVKTIVVTEVLQVLCAGSIYCPFQLTDITCKLPATNSWLRVKEPCRSKKDWTLIKHIKWAPWPFLFLCKLPHASCLTRRQVSLANLCKSHQKTKQAQVTTFSWPKYRRNLLQK